MQPRHVLRALALAFLVAAPVLAQSTRRIVVNGAAAAAAPASGGATAPAPATGGLPTAQPGPTTVAPGPGVNREELTPEQKAAMKEVDRMRAEKARIDAELALADAKAGANGRVREELPTAGPCDLWWVYDPRVEYVIR